MARISLIRTACHRIRILVRSRMPERVRTKVRRLRIRLLTIGLHNCRRQDPTAAEQQMSGLVSVVVPIHDAPDMTERCLHSLERNGGNVEVVLVDDGSNLPRTREIIKEARRRNGWAVLRHDVAVGHSRSCERGAQSCHRPYVCLLNSDTIVTPWTWAGVVQAFDSDPKIVVVGPSTSCASTIQVVPRAAHCRFAWSDLQIEEFARRYTVHHRGSPLIDLDYAGGFAFFIKREVWERCGGFDKNLANYGNEVELCRRLKREGHRVVWTRASYVHHFGEASFILHFTTGQLSGQRKAATQYIEAKHGNTQNQTPHNE